MKPFIKWAGGKRALIPQLSLLFPKDFNNYFEPFLGGGAVFFHLQEEKSFLSDINEELINVYEVIKTHPKEVIELLESLEYSKENFLKIRAWDREEGGLKRYSTIKRAGRFIYLNRTCFNGLYRVNSKGEFNVPFGKYKNPNFVQKDNIMEASKLLNKVNIKCWGFEEALLRAQKGDFVYCDPPYDTINSSFTAYDKSGFGKDMQIKLAETLKELDKRGVLFMVSNHNTDFIQELYSGFRCEIVKTKRRISADPRNRCSISELVYLNY